MLVNDSGFFKNNIYFDNCIIIIMILSIIIIHFKIWLCAILKYFFSCGLQYEWSAALYNMDRIKNVTISCAVVVITLNLVILVFLCVVQ